MRKIFIAGLAAGVVSSSYLLLAQQPPPPAGQPAPPPPPMSFFVASAGSGKGADLGGLAGADRICQTLATAAGSTKTWHAYLSAAAANGQPAVNARDRIGTGPWYNAKGARVAQNVADLHGDTLEAARRGNNMTKVTAINEKGETINGVGDTPNKHDILTGSQPDGTAFRGSEDLTCRNWTSSGTGRAQVGHHDRKGQGQGVNSWNSVHASRGCSQQDLEGTGGAGLFYCFAVD